MAVSDNMIVSRSILYQPMLGSSLAHRALYEAKAAGRALLLGTPGDLATASGTRSEDKPADTGR